MNLPFACAASWKRGKQENMYLPAHALAIN